MSVVGVTCPIASRAMYVFTTCGGTGNLDPETWSGVNLRNVLLDQVGLSPRGSCEDLVLVTPGAWCKRSVN